MNALGLSFSVCRLDCNWLALRGHGKGATPAHSRLSPSSLIYVKMPSWGSPTARHNAHPPHISCHPQKQTADWERSFRNAGRGGAVTELEAQAKGGSSVGNHAEVPAPCQSLVAPPPAQGQRHWCARHLPGPGGHPSRCRTTPQSRGLQAAHTSHGGSLQCPLMWTPLSGRVYVTPQVLVTRDNGNLISYFHSGNQD